MSKRSVTSITMQVHVRVPPGSTAAEVLGYTLDALIAHKATLDCKLPIAAIDHKSIIIRLIKRETVYL